MFMVNRMDVAVRNVIQNSNDRKRSPRKAVNLFKKSVSITEKSVVALSVGGVPFALMHYGRTDSKTVRRIRLNKLC